MTPRQTCPRPNGFRRNLRSKTRWFTGFCNSHQVSHFATFFIDARAKISVAESRLDILKTTKPLERTPFPGRRGNALSFKFLGAIHAGVCFTLGRYHCNTAIPPRRGEERTGPSSPSVGHVLLWFCWAGFDNDPSAGSPTETLLRLLLPLNDKVQWTSRDVADSEPPTSPRSENFTGPFNR